MPVKRGRVAKTQPILRRSLGPILTGRLIPGASFQSPDYQAQLQNLQFPRVHSSYILRSQRGDYAFVSQIATPTFHLNPTSSFQPSLPPLGQTFQPESASRPADSTQSVHPESSLHAQSHRQNLHLPLRSPETTVPQRLPGQPSRFWDQQTRAWELNHSVINSTLPLPLETVETPIQQPTPQRPSSFYDRETRDWVNDQSISNPSNPPLPLEAVETPIDQHLPQQPDSFWDQQTRNWEDGHSSINSILEVSRREAIMNDYNNTQRSGGRGSAHDSTPRHSSLLNPTTPSRRSRDGSYIHPNAITPQKLQSSLISKPGINPYTQREDPNWSSASLRAYLGPHVWENIITQRAVLSRSEVEYLRGLAYAYDDGSAERGRQRFEERLGSHRLDSTSRDNRMSGGIIDPFTENVGEETGTSGSSFQNYNTFGSTYDQRQQSEYCQQYEYGQQDGYQQPSGYGQGSSYMQPPTLGYTSPYDTSATSYPRLPPRLQHQAVKGTQADDALNRGSRAPSTQQNKPAQMSLPSLQDYQNLSTPMQKGFVEAKGLASPKDNVGFHSGMPRNQRRDAAPYTGFTTREMNEEVESQLPGSPGSVITVLHDRARQASYNASAIGSNSAMRMQPPQLYSGQQNTGMTTAEKAETEKAIYDNYLKEAMAAPAPTGPLRGIAQMRQYNAAGFEGMSAAQRQAAGGYPQMNDAPRSHEDHSKVMGGFTWDNDVLGYDQTGRSFPSIPLGFSQGQDLGSSRWSTNDMTGESKEGAGPLKSAIQWYGKPTEQDKEAAIMKENAMQTGSRIKRELDQGSDPLPSNFSTPKKDKNGKEAAYMSPIGTGRPRLGSSTSPSGSERTTMTALQHVKEYKDVAKANGSDGFAKFGQPPAHATDYSSNGNNSLFGTEWNPPARVGRDPRHQTTLHDGRPTLFMDPPSASGSTGRGYGPF